MARLPLLSAGRRFLRTLLFALFQAILFGALVSWLLSTRPSRGEPEGLLEGVRAALERLELRTYDWRAAALASRPQEGAPEVVLVTIDRETRANSRLNERLDVASTPWPRALLGGLIDQLHREGARAVLVDLPLSTWSPHSSGGAGSQRTFEPGAPRASNDDEALAAALLEYPGRTVLPFEWERDREPLALLQPHAFVLEVARAPTRAAAAEGVARIASGRRPAYVEPSGDRFRVLAGVASVAEGETLARRWGVTPRLEPLTPAQRAHRVSPVQLLVGLTKLEVSGFDREALPAARAVIPPVPPLLRPSLGHGATRLLPELDGQVRALPHLLHFVPGGGEPTVVLPSAPLAMARLLSTPRGPGAPGPEVALEEHRLVFGARNDLVTGEEATEATAVPIEDDGRAWIRWYARAGGAAGRGLLSRSVSAWRVLVNHLDRAQGRPPHYRNGIEGKVVVLTSTVDGPKVETPLGPLHRGEVLAQALDNLLRGQGIERVEPSTDALIALGMAFVGALLALTLGGRVDSRRALLGYLGSFTVATLVYSWLARRFFLEEQLWIAVAGPLVAMASAFFLTTAYAYRSERWVGELLESALGRYLVPEVARRLSRDLTLMRPERRQVTVFFSDIQGFTQLSARLAPAKLVQLLNEFFDEMSAVVRQHEGQLDKYMGDSVMAFWGAPVAVDGHAERACEAALAMHTRLEARQERWERVYGCRLEYVAGLNSGEVVAGEVGSDLKSSYTVLGGAVGLAAWLERANRLYGTRILVGEQTARACSGRFAFREVDRVRGPGDGLAQTVFELMGERAAIDAAAQAELARHQQALVAYHGRRFAEARDLFATQQGDPVAELYVERCRRYLETPPPPEWDGVSERRAVA